MVDRSECSIRHENGNCSCMGGFCTAVSDEICNALQSAYYTGIAFAVLGFMKPIRCAECKYYDKRDAPGGLGWCSRPGAGCGQPEDFFCAAAERKEKAGDA